MSRRRRQPRVLTIAAMEHRIAQLNTLRKDLRMFGGDTSEVDAERRAWLRFRRWAKGRVELAERLVHSTEKHEATQG
jgi:hypothetical protein